MRGIGDRKKRKFKEKEHLKKANKNQPQREKRCLTRVIFSRRIRGEGGAPIRIRPVKKEGGKKTKKLPSDDEAKGFTKGPHR